MFTGIIEAIGTLKSARAKQAAKVLTIDIGKLAEGTNTGDSIAVNGICLTVSRLTGTIAEFDVSQETLKRSTLTRLTPPAAVNLERALRPDGRFGGHMVQGHIDGTAGISNIKKNNEFAEITFTAEKKLLDEIITKGSIAVNGISLTVAGMNANSFTVSLIPTTLKETTLANAKPGDEVNIETDIIIKAVKNELKKILPQKQGLSTDKLRKLGF